MASVATLGYPASCCSASPARTTVDILKEFDALRSAKRFQALLDLTTEILQRGLPAELLSSHQFWTYRGFACMQLLATQPPARAAASFRRALLLGPPREKRFGLCAAIEVLQILGSIARLREGRRRFGRQCDGYAAEAAPGDRAPTAQTEGGQKDLLEEDTRTALRRMLASACAEQPEEPYDDKAIQTDGVVRFLDVEKEELLHGSASVQRRSREVWAALRYVFFTDADRAGWLYIGSEDGRPDNLSWGNAPQQLFDMSDGDWYVPGLSGERSLPPGIFISGSGCQQSVDAQVWLKTTHFDFRSHRTPELSARLQAVRGRRMRPTPMLMPRRFPRWDSLLARQSVASGADMGVDDARVTSTLDVTVVQQPHPELDVFYVLPEHTEIPKSVHDCLRDELDRLAKRSGPADFPVPKYHNILDPNKFAVAERVLEFVGTDGCSPEVRGAQGSHGVDQSTETNRDIYAVDYPVWKATRLVSVPSSPATDLGGCIIQGRLEKEREDGDEGQRDAAVSASCSAARRASPLAFHKGRLPLRWTCAEVRVKEKKCSLRESVVLLLLWVRKACRVTDRERKYFPQPLVRLILEFAGSVHAAAKVEWTSAIHDLDPLRYHKLYFALARVLEAAMPLVARLKKPAVLLQSESLPKEYRESGSILQVVVKAQRIFLSPSEDYVGLWHQDGLHEHICAVVLYYYRAGVLEGGALEFCSSSSEFCDSISDARSSEGLPRCQVPVKEGTLVVFSNYQVVHRVLRMQAREGEGGGGSRDFVAFFLVDQARPLRVGDHVADHPSQLRQPQDLPRTDKERLGFLQKQLQPRVGFGTNRRFGLTTTGNGDPRDLGWVQAELTGMATDADSNWDWLGTDCAPVARLQGLNFPPPLGRGGSWGMNVNADHAIKWDVQSPWIALAEEEDEEAFGEAVVRSANPRITRFRNELTGKEEVELPTDSSGSKVGISDVEFL